MNEQLTLGIRLRDDATFENFYAGHNVSVIKQLKYFLQHPIEHCFYLWGPRNVGRSHLLQASCHLLSQQQLNCIYLPLGTPQLTPMILQDLANLDGIFLDDIDQVIAKPDWAEALFHCFNHSRMTQSRLMLSATCAIKQLPCPLTDLNSRLAWGYNYQLKPLNDQQKLAALQIRARQRGLLLNEEVLRYLLRHYPRDFRSLFLALDKLEHASLQQSRRLTIPFIKETLQPH